MSTYKAVLGWLAPVVLILAGCSDAGQITGPQTHSTMQQEGHAMSWSKHGDTGVLTANGWYEEDEIYYINRGVEEGIAQRGRNQIYLIGGDRAYQANVVLFIPGEPGYSPHWNVNIVHTAPGVTAGDILASPYASAHFDEEGVLLDDVEDILGAEEAGLVVLEKPGVVVLCPIISEEGAEAPGNTLLSEDFPPFDLGAGF